MGVLLSKVEAIAADSSDALGGFSLTADGGIASDKIAFILQAAIEAAQLSVDATYGLVAVGSAALDGQLEDEAAIYEALNNFHGASFE